MDESENNNLQKYIESIELQHRQKIISTKQAFVSLITILQEKPEMSRFVNLVYYKNTGFTENLYIFLQLINLCEENVAFLCDKHVLCFLAQIIAKFCAKENINNEEHSDFDTINVDDSNNNSHNGQILDNIFDTQKQKYENSLINYIDDDIVIEIFDIFTNIFNKDDNIFLLSLLYEIGFFDLFFVINVEQTCKLLDSIYKNKIYCQKDEEVNSKTKSTNNLIIEVKRRMFDSQIITKNKDFIDNKVFANKKKTYEVLYTKIINEFANKNLSYFVKENEISNMTHTLSFALSYFVCTNSKHKEEFFDILYTDTVIDGIKRFIAKKLMEECIDFYILLLHNSTMQKNYKIIISKLVCDYEINKKLFKMLEVKNKETKKNVFVVFGYFVELIDFYNTNVTEKINMQNILDVIGKENIVKSLFDTLNYKFDERYVVVSLLNKLYFHCNKELFYKISYIVIVRHVIVDFDMKFANKYFLDLLDYLKTDKNNFIKLMFSKTKDKHNKKIGTDKENVISKNDKTESSDESSEIFRKRLNIN